MPDLHVLVVDDDTLDRMAVQRALRRAPLEATLVVHEAESAEDAFAALDREEFDCVLLDLHLPGQTGLDVLASMRSRERRPAVVMLTGQGDEQTAVDAMKAGAADYLTKATLEPARLARSILHAIRVREGERAAAIARARLEAAEQRYRFLADSIPQMVWVTTADDVVEYVNDQWVAYTGFPLERAGRAYWATLVHPDDLPELEARWDEARATASRFEMQVRLRRHQDGAYRWHLSRAERHRANDGVVRWFGTLTDIEDQKRGEAELVRMTEIAEHERRRAEEANAAKDQFLAVLSHELRTPLNAILGWVSMLRMANASQDMLTRGLAIIERSARTQTQLIEDLLDVSRIMAGKLVLERRVLDLRDAVAAALETVQPSAMAKEIALESEVPNDALVVHGDPARLQQVLWNLLVNAVKFTPQGGRVWITAEHDGDRVVVRVRDNGEGIDPAFLPHVFDRFRQAEGSLTRNRSGLGLGLSIVRHIVERHGGTIEASSGGLGQGATFTVTLPAATAGIDSGPRLAEPRSAV